MNVAISTHFPSVADIIYVVFGKCRETHFFIIWSPIVHKEMFVVFMVKQQPIEISFSYTHMFLQFLIVSLKEIHN